MLQPLIYHVPGIDWAKDYSISQVIELKTCQMGASATPFYIDEPLPMLSTPAFETGNVCQAPLLLHSVDFDIL